MSRKKLGTYLGGSSIVHARVSTETVALHQAELRALEKEHDKLSENERKRRERKFAKLARWRQGWRRLDRG